MINLQHLQPVVFLIKSDYVRLASLNATYMTDNIICSTNAANNKVDEAAQLLSSIY